MTVYTEIYKSPRSSGSIVFMMSCSVYIINRIIQVFTGHGSAGRAGSCLKKGYILAGFLSSFR